MLFEDLTWLFTNSNHNRNIVKLNFNEAALLYKTTRQSWGNILEIGRYNGGSTMILHAASHDSRKIYSVDLINRVDKIVAQHLTERVIFMDQDSKIKIHTVFGLIFIDGNHSPEGVQADIDTHWENLDVDGYAVFHDAIGVSPGKDYWPGVKKATDTLINKNFAAKVDSAGSLLVLRKTGELK